MTSEDIAKEYFPGCTECRLNATAIGASSKVIPAKGLAQKCTSLLASVESSSVTVNLFPAFEIIVFKILATLDSISNAPVTRSNSLLTNVTSSPVVFLLMESTDIVGILSFRLMLKSTVDTEVPTCCVPASVPSKLELISSQNVVTPAANRSALSAYAS